MLMRKTSSPVDYRMCNQTVTVYHKDKEDGKITRTVHENVFFDFKKTQSIDKTGSKEANSFLLVIPGNSQMVFVGDKVLRGTGREVAASEWKSFIPVNVPGLVVVKYVDPKYWGEQLVHTEAGG